MSRRGVRNECLGLGANEAKLESDVTRVQLVWEETPLTVKLRELAEDNGTLARIRAGKQDELLGVRSHFIGFSCEFPGAQHFRGDIVSDRSSHWWANVFKECLSGM